MTVLPTDTNSHDFTHLDRSQTFDYMVTLIQDEIDDTTAEYSVQIQDSIFTAVRLCEREPFFFNEKRMVTFKTQIGKTWYGQKDGFFLYPEMILDAVFLGTHTSTQTQLFFKPSEALQKQYGVQPPLATPAFYTCSDQKIGLFPTPSKVETVRLSYARAHFGEGTDKDKQEDHPWFMHAFDLIKARAKYELYKNILKDPEYAAVSFNDFQEQLQILRTETSRRKGVSNILPMTF
ncbi:hypothetical protein [Candidatus Bartonella washoeensis]|uniref:Uncharacterized protein n=1 Tax=Cardidatus Bartonella washoeensis 085-0475 TaxID=1094564 RepID=J0QDW4_9HYPH|nr:hypothetical protein [Bartonella washoeensis]EJF83561.1 hypothetical protein MCW_01330 [Bartonella washoeensis 085-0475]